MFIYFWQRQSMNGGGSGREGDTESETGPRLWAVSTEPDVGLELTDREIMTWAEVRRLTDWATQAPRLVFLILAILTGVRWYLVMVLVLALIFSLDFWQNMAYTENRDLLLIFPKHH